MEHEEFVKKRDRALRNLTAISNAVLNLKPGQEITVDGRELLDCYQYNYNELKGQNPFKELEKWLEFVNKVHGIEYAYNNHQTEIYFRNPKPVLEEKRNDIAVSVIKSGKKIKVRLVVYPKRKASV